MQTQVSECRKPMPRLNITVEAAVRTVRGFTIFRDNGFAQANIHISGLNLVFTDLTMV